MVQRTARVDRPAIPLRFGLRLLAQALFLVTAFAAMGALREHHWPLGGLDAFVIASVLSFLAVLVHQLAHAAVAQRVGADVLKIVALPLELKLRPRRLRFVGTAGRADLGGYVSYHLDRVDAARKHAIIAVAGPLANLVSAVLAGGAAALLDTRHPAAVYSASGEPAAPALAAAFMLVSLGMGLGNLVPFDRSDGMHLWRYFRRNAR